MTDPPDVDLPDVTWSLERLLAHHLRFYDADPTDQARLEDVAEHHAEVLAAQPADVRERWEQAGTWLEPPALVEQPGGDLRIVDGVTRLGILRGRMKDRLIVDRRLDVWVGRPSS
jgi:hypothetical protein